MKILHIVQTYLPAYRYGGPIRTVHELNKWLVKKGVEVTVYTTNIDGPNDLDVPLNQEVNIDGVKVFYFKSSFPRFWFYSKYLRRALKENAKNFDLIHSTAVFLMASSLGAYYAKKFSKPFVLSPRGSLMDAPLKHHFFRKKLYLNLIEKRNLAKTSAIHFTTHAEKEEYLKTRLFLKKSIIIPNGVNISEFDQDIKLGFFRNKFKIGPDKKIILCLGRLNWKKGFDTLIPAFSEVVAKDKKAVLVLAGSDDDNYAKNIKSMITDYCLQDYVVFTGMVTGKDRIAAYKDANVFVLPSYSENFGMVVIEAMISSLPIIITKGVGISTEVEKAGAGLVVDKDARQVSGAILKILENNVMGREMGGRGRKFAEDNFSWDKIAESFAKEYNDLIINKT